MAWFSFCDLRSLLGCFHCIVPQQGGHSLSHSAVGLFGSAVGIHLLVCWVQKGPLVSDVVLLNHEYCLRWRLLSGLERAAQVQKATVGSDELWWVLDTAVTFHELRSSKWKPQTNLKHWCIVQRGQSMGWCPQAPHCVYNSYSHLGLQPWATIRGMSHLHLSLASCRRIQEIN